MPAPKRPVPEIKKKGPPGQDLKLALSRKRGALFGLAVGDALGTTHEFRKLLAPPFPTLAAGPHTEMTGAGPFNLKPGQVTDDTHMACCIGEVLRSLRRYDPLEAAKGYARWRKVTFDIGNQTAEAIDAFTVGNFFTPLPVGRSHWLKSARKSAGNGSLMRTAPLGVFFASNRDARVRASLEDSALTHYDPRCQLSCVALNGSIAAPIGSAKPPRPAEIARAALVDVSLAAAHLAKAQSEDVLYIQDAVEALQEDLEFAAAADPELYGPELHLFNTAGYVRVAFRLAYWELFHAPSFEAALIDVVNRGGDSDTNAAIAGALLGAVHGEAGIPERWRTPVLEVFSITRAGPFWDLYHPRLLLDGLA